VDKEFSEKDNFLRTILVATVGRSDFGIYRQVLNRIAATPGLRYELLVSGAHLSSKSGETVTEIEAENRPIAAKIPLPETGDTQSAMASAMGVALSGTAALFSTKRPDLLLVAGDRFEMFAIAAAAVPFNIPIAHIHGGEVSFGAIDEVFRHAITKMAHLHFPATADYAARLLRMGEEPWRVTVTGAPGLDNVRLETLPDRAELSRRFSIPLDRPPLLITFHPVTRQAEDAVRQIRAVLDALRRIDVPVVFTAPNADAGADLVRREIAGFLKERPQSWLVENFGALNYLAMLRESAAMAGNSSSGLVEGPAFKIPVVNIGDRQQGRTRASNIIDVAADAEAIFAGIQRALDPAFRAGLADMINPYGDGHASEKIAAVLASAELDARLLVKRFYDGV
jgi:UDP-hydrolysing UDP-N-acetyl-D-glucosamine 2-epimerase